ncbi:hypothetical protein CHRYSEOSP005_18960 [Chryseobacterium sp. Alg-005]|uniref:hypothetical protein n=1 Tax=Chryseobacterium sp. Alg-005 TaxID=3159516 RepID=UPI0035558AE0
MEKLQKYCLSVLLVIICGNIPAQIANGSTEPTEYNNLCEIYTQLLGQKPGDTHQSCASKKPKYYHAIHHKQNAIGVIGKAGFEKEYNKVNPHDAVPCLGIKKHDLVRVNFKSYNKNSSTGTLYFRTIVSKIRNKDYLDLLG